MTTAIEQTVQDCIHQSWLLMEEIGCDPRSYVIRVNRRPVSADHVLRNGDKMSVIPHNVTSKMLQYGGGLFGCVPSPLVEGDLHRKTVVCRTCGFSRPKRDDELQALRDLLNAEREDELRNLGLDED